ncbi:MAG: assimilatory sulfite reductase (NADPH) flavoprotein subunit, partial [Dyella sp.]
RERGAELYDWLAGGAHLYVCGDAAQMAKDVHATLAEIVATHGGKTPEAAQVWLSELLQDGRYARDVY